MRECYGGEETSMSQKCTALIYDADTIANVLGLPVLCTDPAPAAPESETVIYYGGWSLKDLRHCKAGRECMWQDQEWYDDFLWDAEPGYYRVHLRFPQSNGQTWEEQCARLGANQSTWEPAPVCVAATALLAHLARTGENLLRNGWCRCIGIPNGDFCPALTVYYGHVYVSDGGSLLKLSNLWLSVARKA
jgi:hypothetical protein